MNPVVHEAGPGSSSELDNAALPLETWLIASQNLQHFSIKE